MSLALARKFRPKNFHQLVGQKHVSQALIYALDKADIHHAYLFTGTRGVGKTTIARIFAKSLNCEKGITSQPCGECSACREIDNGSFPDLIEIDAASRSQVESTRQFLSDVPYKPVKGRFKVYLIDEVHMFSDGSFNALLKTLEEPPEHVKFILATTDPQKIPQTVISRCLQFQLKNMTESQISGHLSKILQEEGLKFEAEALDFIAEAAQGSMRDALSILDQAKSYCRGEIKAQECASLLGAVPARKVKAILRAVALGEAKTLREELKSLDEYAPDYSDLLRKIIKTLQELTIAQLKAQRYSNEIAEDLVQLAEALPKELVQLWYQIAIDSFQSIAYQPDSALALEMTLLRMIAFRPILNLERAEKLEAVPQIKPEVKEEFNSKNPASNEEILNQALEEARQEREEFIQSVKEEIDEPPFEVEEEKKKLSLEERINNLEQELENLINEKNVEDWFEIIQNLPHKGNFQYQEDLATDFFPVSFAENFLTLKTTEYWLIPNNYQHLEEFRKFLAHFLGQNLRLEFVLKTEVLNYAEVQQLQKKEAERKRFMMFKESPTNKLLEGLGIKVQEVKELKDESF